MEEKVIAGQFAKGYDCFQVIVSHYAKGRESQRNRPIRWLPALAEECFRLIPAEHLQGHLW